MPKAPTTIHGEHPGFAAAQQKNNQTKNRINNLGNSRTNSQQSSASKKRSGANYKDCGDFKELKSN